MTINLYKFSTLKHRNPDPSQSQCNSKYSDPTSKFKQLDQVINSHPLPALSDSDLCCFLNESTGRPLPRFHAENSPVSGIEEDIGIGDNAIVRDPPGPYFLGLPLFFFISELGMATLTGAGVGADPGAGAGAVAGVGAGAATGDTAVIVDPPNSLGFSLLAATR